jgi:hypothetical protein
MEEQRPHHTCEIQRRLSNTAAKLRCSLADFGKKNDSGSARKEKQLLEKLVQPPEIALTC